MIIVRNTFTAKPGQAGKLAAHLKEMAGSGFLRNPRVLTDLIGPFNQVVLEHEVDTVADFESGLQQYMSDPEIREKARAYLDLWTTGKRELWRVA